MQKMMTIIMATEPKHRPDPKSSGSRRLTGFGILGPGMGPRAVLSGGLSGVLSSPPIKWEDVKCSSCGAILHVK